MSTINHDGVDYDVLVVRTNQDETDQPFHPEESTATMAIVTPLLTAMARCEGSVAVHLAFKDSSSGENWRFVVKRA